MLPEIVVLVALFADALGIVWAVGVDTVGSKLGPAVVVIALLAHAFGVIFVVNVWTSCD